MPNRFALIAVEGHHDQAFVGKVLKIFGLRAIANDLNALNPFWTPLLPVYPSGSLLHLRLTVPSVYEDDTLSVAVCTGSGTELRTKFPLTFTNYSQFKTATCALGVVADADSQNPGDVAKAYSAAFRPHFPSFPEQPGAVDVSAIRTGIYVVPDNQQQGVLEHLLIDCGHIAYPNHIRSATAYLGQLSEAEKSHWAPYDQEKALVATVASVLKPGKTNTVSITDNDWISPQTLHLIQPFVQFVSDLLNLPVPTAPHQGISGSALK